MISRRGASGVADWAGSARACSGVAGAGARRRRLRQSSNEACAGGHLRGGDHRGADHEHRREHRRRPGEDHGHRPRGHELAHLRAEAERGRAALDASTSSTSTGSSSRSRRASSPSENLQRRRGDRRARRARASTRSDWIYDFSFPEAERQAQPAPLDRPDATRAATRRWCATTSRSAIPANADVLRGQLRAGSRR